MSQKIDLSAVSDEDLVAALLARVPKDGFLSSPLFDIIADVMPVVCVDGVPYRYINGIPEVLAIRRNNGQFAGKLCTVGGRIYGGRTLTRESVEEALRRHFVCDLGVDITLDSGWQRPFWVGQSAPEGTGLFGPENAKHAVALRYLVKLSDENFVFGEGFGGQEVDGVEWFSKKTLPAPQAFGYDHYETFSVALDQLGLRR